MSQSDIARINSLLALTQKACFHIHILKFFDRSLPAASFDYRRSSEMIMLLGFSIEADGRWPSQVNSENTISPQFLWPSSDKMIFWVFGDNSCPKTNLNPCCAAMECAFRRMSL